MALFRFRPRRRRRHTFLPRNPLRHLRPQFVAVALLAAVGFGWAGANRSPNSTGETVAYAGYQTVATTERRLNIGMCGRDRDTCVVDGDTIWLDGVNLRLESFDTPEPYNDICGGDAEVALAKRASARLLQLLNAYPVTVETFDTDRYGRTLATIRIGGGDVGDILIEEGLARRWPNGAEFWC